MNADYGLVYIGAGIVAVFVAIFLLDYFRRLAKPAPGINLGPVEIEMRFGNQKIQKTLRGDLVESTTWLSKDVQADAKGFIIEKLPQLSQVESMPESKSKDITPVGSQEANALNSVAEKLKKFEFDKVCRIYFLHESFSKEKHMIIQVTNIDKQLLDLASFEPTPSWTFSSGKSNKARVHGLGLSFPTIQPTPFGDVFVHLFDPDNYTSPRVGGKSDEARDKDLVEMKFFGQVVPWIPTITDVKEQVKAKDSIIKGMKESLANMGFEVKVKAVGEDAYHVAISSISRHGSPNAGIPKKFDTIDLAVLALPTFIFALIGQALVPSTPWSWVPGLFIGLLLGSAGVTRR